MPPKPTLYAYLIGFATLSSQRLATGSASSAGAAGPTAGATKAVRQEAPAAPRAELMAPEPPLVVLDRITLVDRP